MPKTRGLPGAGQPAVRVVVADPEVLVLDGVRRLLSRHGRARVEGVASSGQEALRLVQLTHPDVAVVEPHFPHPPQGVALVRALREACPGLAVVVFSDRPTEAHLLRLLAAGAHGFVCKQVTPELLVHAILTAASGGAFVVTASAQPLHKPLELLSAVDKAEEEPVELSEQEWVLLGLVAQGLTDAQIARRLRVATATVRSQLGRLYRKLRTRNRAQALARAVLSGPGHQTGDLRPRDG